MISNDAKSNEVQIHPQLHQNEIVKQEQEERLLNTKKKLKKIAIIFGIIIFILIIVIVVLVIAKKEPDKEPPFQPPQTTGLSFQEKRKIDSEPSFIFPTRVGQFNTIKVIQKYDEISIKKGKNITTSFNRKDIYDILVLSENEPMGDLKYCYTKLYTCAISIVSECESQINKDCIPRTILDLSGESIPSESEIRLLQEVDNIEDLAIPLCLFNITDNNGITSIKCPKSMKEGKIKGIILDLYFYRPPAIKRIDKEKNNITINIENLEDGKVFVRETNGGKCEDNNNFNSFCTTDMNTTKDSEGNLISYKEKATTNVTIDENNNYLKIKESTLIDITEKNNTKKGELYKENMEKLLEKLNPYMHYYEQVSEEQFKEIYELSVNGNLPKIKKIKRKLKESEDGYSKEQIIFEYQELNGPNIFLTLSDDSSINSETMKANSYFKFGEKEEDELINNNLQSILTKVLNKLIILSKAGNKMADELYQNIKHLMGQITEEMGTKLSSLNKLMIYENITQILDTSLQLDDLEKLPQKIVEESKILNENFNKLLEGLKNANTNQKFEVINKNIYNDFLAKSHTLIYEVSNNLTELGDSMNSVENKLSQISLYYLKQHSSSYMNTVEEAQQIFDNYYINEALLINSNINSIIEDFKKYLLEYSGNEIKMIEELYQKLEDETFSIENIDDNLSQETINNLKNSTNVIEDIIQKVQQLIVNKLDKKGEYYITESDKISNNKSFTKSVLKAKEISNTIDNGKLIDKVYNEKMSYFRQNFSEILVNLSIEKETLFSLEEETLQYSLFKDNSKDKINKKFQEFSRNAIKEIENESDEYEKKINETINKFLKENEEELNSLISDLYILFSNESLNELAELYDIAYNSSLNYTTELIKYNENLAKQYLKDMLGVIEDNTYILNMLQSFIQNDPDHLPTIWHVWNDYPNHYDEIKYFNDTITSKNITKTYKNKIEEYLSYIEDSKDYLNNQLELDLMNNYRNPIIKIRKSLQLIKNNKLGDKFPNYSKIGFDKHKQLIDILFNRLEQFLNDSKYNTKYKDPIKTHITSEINYLQNVEQYIKKQNEKISKETVEAIPGYDDDFCVRFKRIGSYLCTNKVWNYKTYSENYCMPLPTYTNNNLKLKKAAINPDENLIIYNNKFNQFYSIINEKINIYVSKINLLKSDLEKIENDIMSKPIVFSHISTFQNDFNTIIDEYYGDKLINSSYDYYQNNIEIKMENFLNKSLNSWEKAFDMIKEEINNNKNSFTSSFNDFSIMAVIYQSIICQNISRAYFNSIVDEQKNAFNYTILYYYNYLLRLSNSTNNYILNRVLANQNKFNYITEQKKMIINEFFLNLMKNITLAEEKSLNYEYQNNLLRVNKTNFFQINETLSNHENILNSSLLNKISSIFTIVQLNNKNIDDQFSISSKMYLEDLENGKQISSLYSSTNDATFILLDTEKKKFEEIIINNNWVFNFDEFNNELGIKLFSLTKEINEKFLTEKEIYKQQLEEIINIYYTKEGLIEKTIELYNDGIKKIDNDMRNTILGNIDDIANYILEYFTNETYRLSNEIIAFDECTVQINNTLKEFINRILNKLNDTLIIIPNEFNQIIEEKLYKDYVESPLINFYDELKVKTSNNDDYNLLNSSYNFGKIINNILLDLQKEYNTIAKKQISYKYNQKVKEVYDIINLDDIQNLLNNKINTKFENDLLPIIKEKTIKNAGYKEYDIDDEKKKEINLLIDEKLSDIEVVINSTKGENYEISKINGWEIPVNIDFSLQEYRDVISDVKTKFEKFYETQKEYERVSIDNLLEEILKRNFNNLLSYLIPSFGKNYFEKILKYNENFKISTLYDNLRFSLSNTLAFYIAITQPKSITALPKDLKLRLYSLNNLEETIETKNNEILNKINDTLDKFIEREQKFILDQYSIKFNNEFSVDERFSPAILSMIRRKLNDNDIQLKKICKDTLINYLKEPFIESYKNVMNKKTYEMLRFANEQKETLRLKIFDKLTINSDEILKKINEKLNMTLESIAEYKNHFKTFKIDNDIIQFLNNYGKNNISPLFSNVIKIVNGAKSNNKDKALEDLKKKSKKYEKQFNENKFIELSNKIYSSFKDNYNNITKYINVYDPINYKEKLQEEKSVYEKRYLRFLEGKETEEDIINRFHEKIADIAIDSTFKEILDISDMTKTFIDNLKEFNTFDDNIKQYLKNINLNLQSSKAIIQEKKEKGIFDNELYDIFMEKLLSLHNMTVEYYNTTKENYDELRNYLKESMNTIDSLLNQCANITYITIADEYNQIKKELIPTPIQEQYSENENYIHNHLNYSFNSSNNGQILYDVDINSNKSANFSIDLEYENIPGKSPTLIAKIVNRSGPKDMTIKITSGTSKCAERERIINAIFGSSTYTMIIYFNTESTKINVTTITNFDDYKYDIKEYKIEPKLAEENYIIINGIKIDLSTVQQDECEKIPNPEGDDEIFIKKKNSTSTNFIDDDKLLFS